MKVLEVGSKAGLILETPNLLVDRGCFHLDCSHDAEHVKTND